MNSSIRAASTRLAIIGGGPRAIGVLERLGANAALCELRARPAACRHRADPHMPGAGRIWRAAESPLLLMNSRAADVSIYPDDTVDCAGPIQAGPSLAEWAEGIRRGTIEAPTAGTERLAEIEALQAEDFPSRRCRPSTSNGSSARSSHDCRRRSRSPCTAPWRPRCAPPPLTALSRSRNRTLLGRAGSMRPTGLAGLSSSRAVTRCTRTCCSWPRDTTMRARRLSGTSWPPSPAATAAPISRRPRPPTRSSTSSPPGTTSSCAAWAWPSST